MGLDTQVYIREIENLPHESFEFDGSSRIVALAVLLTIIVTTLLCGYGLSMLVGTVIR